jgi:hypothetical protein
MVRTMKPIVYLLSICIFILTLLPTQAFAAKHLPFMPSSEEQEIKPVSSDELFGGIIDTVENGITPFYSWGVTIITAIFIVGTVVMVLALLFKNGQWQKYGQGTMFISFIVMIVLRGLPILILSIQTMDDFDLLISKVVTTLCYSTIFIGLVGIAASFLFRFGERLIEHPDFYRWSKNLLTVSILMMVFSIIIPLVFPII